MTVRSSVFVPHYICLGSRTPSSSSVIVIVHALLWLLCVDLLILVLTIEIWRSYLFSLPSVKWITYKNKDCMPAAYIYVFGPKFFSLTPKILFWHLLHFFFYVAPGKDWDIPDLWYIRMYVIPTIYRRPGSAQLL